MPSTFVSKFKRQFEHHDVLTGILNHDGEPSYPCCLGWSVIHMFPINDKEARGRTVNNLLIVQKKHDRINLHPPPPLHPG